MEHIRQYDWCASVPEPNFLKEDDIDNCVIERIIQNKFRDPLISSDSEDEAPKQKIDWNQVFKRTNREDCAFRVFVPGMRGVPCFTKLSSITKQEHFQCLKVICADNPKVLSKQYMPRPTKMDFRVYEEVKEKYLAEQQEYIEWAKTLWTNGHCSRALRPKPTIETVYEAEYKMKAHELESFPKHYNMAAHIDLNGKDDACDMVHQKDLVKVNCKELPKIQYPDPIEKKFHTMRPCPIPEPCSKHPCWFVLPNEKSMSVLPLTEVHRELAQFAVENDAQIIASEGALKCLLETDQEWFLPVSVCQVVDVDGDKRNIMILGSEFTTYKKFSMARTYKAYRHLVEYALVPPSEKAKKLATIESQEDEDDNSQDNSLDYLSNNMDEMDVSSDDEGHLFIDEDADFEAQSPNRRTSSDQEKESTTENKKDKQKETEKPGGKKSKCEKEKKDKEEKDNGKNDNGKNKKKEEFYKCNCKDSLFVTPPPRSYTKWRLKNSTTKQHIDLIVHCSHKNRDESGEVVIEPIVEYQIDLGGSRQTDYKLRSLALSLFLRKNASLLNVRTDNATGEIVTLDSLTKEGFTKQHGNLMPDVSKVLYEMFNQLHGLLPGHYVLKHEISHGPNALLFSTRVQGSEQKLVLDFKYSITAEADEAKSVKTPQVLAPVLLPVHKYRKMLPCAFPPYENMLGREPRKPVAKNKTPPQAIRWPRKSRKKRGKNNC